MNKPIKNWKLPFFIWICSVVAFILIAFIKSSSTVTDLDNALLGFVVLTGIISFLIFILILLSIVFEDTKDQTKKSDTKQKKLINLKSPFILPLIIIFALISGWFYWFQWRPVQVRKDCIAKLKKNAKEGTKYTLKGGTLFYRMCLIEQGMKPEDLIPSGLLD